ncbi:MAG: hypothetical protein HOG03_15965 [Desulfobacula sp.]|jgi:hypothetical protein|uniref:hypothetical protein n=1 Tax=Desulfobacula sp. TaxID=2593537 RepID=UPI001D714676|nr:hypothetical protein [Desulfobacula sp.]MBT3487187.1 hypothetical protein [Desulfobacula sp.]MBT3806078.1 hypothetical protein [Desulfobacula sp.]MBT4026749.1 hypothetical protein [Desulfobacula sp.]MBT4199442.1 hypothetical protein [Desulfobacula sp.]
MKRFGLIIIAAVIFLGGIFPVLADPIKVVPFVFLKQEFSDNIHFSSNNEEEDFITTLTGGLAVKQKKEVMQAGFEARVDKLLYQDSDNLDSLDLFFSGNVNYRATERLGVGAKVQYSEDSRRDRESDTTGLLVSGDRNTRRFSVSSDYLFSETTKGDISLGYGRVKTEESGRVEDDDDFRVDISFSRNLSETYKNTTGLLNFSYLRYISEIETTTMGPILTGSLFQDNTSDIFQFSTGFSKDITQLYHIYFLVGGSYSKTTEGLRARQTLTGSGIVLGEVVSADLDDDKWGGLVSMGLNYNGLYYDMGLSLSRDMQGATGTNGTVQRSSISANIDRKISDQFFLTLDASLHLNENERKNQADTEELTFNIQPGIRYEFANDLTLSCVYKFTSVEDRQNKSTREQNIIYVVIKKEFELLTL